MVGYRDTTIQKVTPLGALDGSWDISAGGRSGGDLYFTRLRGASSGKVEVHMLTAASGYTSYGVHAATALGSLPATQVAQALVARGTGDLYLVLRSGTGSGRTEVHALTAASGYRSWSLHAATPSGQTPDRTQSQWALGTATRPDLFYLPTTGTGSGRVEVHRLSASTSYGTWTLHAATNLPATPYPAWQLTLG